MTENELRKIAREIADNIFNPRDRDGHTLISLLNSATKRLTSRYEADLLAVLINEESNVLIKEKSDNILAEYAKLREKDKEALKERLNRVIAEAEKERKRFEADKYAYYYNIFQIGEA